MPKQRFTTEEIIHKLREADVLSGQGQTVAQVCKQLGVTDKTYFRWRKSHGGLRIDQAKRMKDLEAENGRLRKAVELQPDPAPQRARLSAARAGDDCGGFDGEEDNRRDSQRCITDIRTGSVNVGRSRPIDSGTSGATER
jgi:transposase-like protein